MYMKSLSSKEDLLLIWCQLFIFVKRKWQTGSNTLFSRANTRKRSLSMFNTLLLSIKRLYASILCAECHQHLIARRVCPIPARMQIENSYISKIEKVVYMFQQNRCTLLKAAINCQY